MLDTTINDAVAESTTPPEYYVGTVVFREDPDKLNRIKVTIPGKMEGPVETLPWVAPARLAPFGQGQGYGVYGVPPLGSLVRVDLQDDDTDYGFYDTGIFCINCANPDFADVDSWGWADPGGTKLVVNSRTQSYMFQHSSGTSFQIDASGNLTVHVAGNLTVTTEGNYHHQVGGDASFDVGGNFSVNAERIDLN